MVKVREMPDLFYFYRVTKGLKRLTPVEAKQKIGRYCAFQERSHQEVKDKLFEYGLNSSEVDAILTQLITEGFVNEERFARAFARGKFRMKHWGRVKIIHELQRRGLTSNCIKAGLREIEDSDYRDGLAEILSRKASQIADADIFVRRDKVAKYAIQKGYEAELVWELVKELMKS
jgi:regulatory protein